jgi:general secretion pathway protein M
MQQLKQWYKGLDQNEQKMVMMAAIFFGLVILIFAILKPLNDSVKQLQMQVDSRQASVEKWRQAMPLILSSQGSGGSNVSSDMNLSTVITSTSRQFNLSVSRVQEKNNNEIQVWFDNVAFKDFLRWTAQVKNQHGVKVAAVNIRSKDRDGLTSIDVKLQK